MYYSHEFPAGETQKTLFLIRMRASSVPIDMQTSGIEEDSLPLLGLKADAFPLYPVPETGLNAPMTREGKIGAQAKAANDPATAGPVTFDDLLVAVGATRNRDAFVRIFEHFAPRVKSFLMKGGLAPDQADELAQETMLTVWHRATSYDPAQAGASTWIFTIARNKRTDFLRRKTMVVADVDPMIADENAERPDEAAARSEEDKVLAAALAELPPDQASLVRKAFFEDKSHSDIAAETNLPLGTVKSRLRLAMDRMRRHVKDLQP